MTQYIKDTIADMRTALRRFPRPLELDAASGDAGIIHINNGDLMYHEVVMNYGDASAVVSIVNSLGGILDRLEALERVADIVRTGHVISYDLACALAALEV